MLVKGAPDNKVTGYGEIMVLVVHNTIQHDVQQQNEPDVCNYAIIHTKYFLAMKDLTH